MPGEVPAQAGTHNTKSRFQFCPERFRSATAPCGSDNESARSEETLLILFVESRPRKLSSARQLPSSIYAIKIDRTGVDATPSSLTSQAQWQEMDSILGIADNDAPGDLLSHFPAVGLQSWRSFHCLGIQRLHGPVRIVYQENRVAALPK